MPAPITLTSAANPRIKAIVKLRQRSHRDSLDCMLIEGYREILRALTNGHPLRELYFARELFMGTHEDDLLSRAQASGASLFACAGEVFAKISYRDRPDGLLAIAPPVRHTLESLQPRHPALIVVAEAIEKPGNLGSILRSADGADADAVLVCDRCTDINNPNVVRASIGTIFARPVVETDRVSALAWLRARGIRIVATTPAATAIYTDTDLVSPCAIVLGTEQYGLSREWLDAADLRVRIPMMGQSDSLNVATAATLLLYETLRQRGNAIRLRA